MYNDVYEYNMYSILLLSLYSSLYQCTSTVKIYGVYCINFILVYNTVISISDTNLQYEYDTMYN